MAMKLVQYLCIGRLEKFLSLLFSVVFIIWEENHPLKANVFFNVYLPIVRAECLNSEFENFNHQIIANSPQNATEIVGILKYVRKLGFLRKVGFFEKKADFFSESVKVVHLLWNAYQMILFL